MPDRLAEHASHDTIGGPPTHERGAYSVKWAILDLPPTFPILAQEVLYLLH
jgi:hypothetical protein